MYNHYCRYSSKSNSAGGKRQLFAVVRELLEIKNSHRMH